MPSLAGLFSFFLSPAGLVALGVLDSSFLFVVPLLLDGVLIALAAANPERAWLYPLLATAGSLAGAAATFWLGRTLGDAGLTRLVPPRLLERARRKTQNGGAVALALPGLIPPPFPFKAFVLAAGALDVDRRRFFATLTVMRLVRFGTGTALAVIYGEWIAAVLESEAFTRIIEGLIAVAVAGTAWSVYKLVKSGRDEPRTMKARRR